GTGRPDLRTDRADRNRCRENARVLQDLEDRGDDDGRVWTRGSRAQAQTSHRRKRGVPLMPRLESLRQNSNDWRDWRRGGLGSSDAPVVMGDSRWMMPRTLWEIKTHRSEEPERDSLATRRGRKLEAAARAAYEAETAEIMEPHCLSHDHLSWMRASLDGLNFDASLVLEIKCPLRSRDHALALEGQVPRHYYAQLQHQLEVSRARELHYWSFDGRRGALVKVMPDHGYIERLVQAEVEFWRNVTENRWPEPRFKEQ